MFHYGDGEYDENYNFVVFHGDYILAGWVLS